MRLSRPQYGLEEQIVEAIYALRQKKSSQIFREAVDVNKVLDYLDVIKVPMDLTKILTKLKSGEYEFPHNIYQDLELIIANCRKYNRIQAILKKADQFMQCIKTVWGNFKKEIQKKGISYTQKISINEDLLKRIAMIEEKRTKKKIPALQAVIEQERKNILPQSNMLPPIQIDFQRADKEQLPPDLQFNAENYSSLERDAKKQLLTLRLNNESIAEEFEKISEKKLKKYRKCIKKRLFWFDKKIIEKCLAKKAFEKMQVPKHLHAFIENGNIADELSIRKLQMYVKKLANWVEDNSNILSDYMKDRFVENCKQMKKCIHRVIKYKKPQRKGLDISLDLKNIKNEMDFQVNIENQKEQDNYENKMKEFKRILDKDRQKSNKRDTKIILRNQNGVMQVYDWTSDKKQQRGVRKQGGGTRIQQVDNDEKKKQEERRRQELRKDQQFLLEYSKKSNAQIVIKYGNRLAIDWQQVHNKNVELAKQILINFTDDDNNP